MSTDFFKQKPKPPFYYQFLLSSIDNEKEIFNVMKNLFFIGICYHFNISIFDLHTINENHINTISEYLLSLGIKVYFKTFDYEQLDFLYQDCLNDLQYIQNVELIVSTDFKTQLIQMLKINSTITNLDKIKEFNKLLEKHFILNFFEKWYSPTKLKEFYIPIEIIKYKDKKKCKCSLIYFDYFNNYSFLDYNHR